MVTIEVGDLGSALRLDRAWGAALTLIVPVFVLTAVARLIARRFTVRA